MQLNWFWQKALSWLKAKTCYDLNILLYVMFGTVFLEKHCEKDSSLMPRNGLTDYWVRQGFLDTPSLNKNLNNFKTVQAMTTKLSDFC